MKRGSAFPRGSQERVRMKVEVGKDIQRTPQKEATALFLGSVQTLIFLSGGKMDVLWGKPQAVNSY